MPTIKDVALSANVSVATVSRALNSPSKVSAATKSKVDIAVKKLGFVLNANARDLVTRSSKTIGVVLSDLSDPFFATIAHVIERKASEKGIKVLISTGSLTADKELQAINNLRAEGCNAIIVNSKALDNNTLITLANNIKGFVVLNRWIKAISAQCVWFDNQAGGRLMAKHITALGHTKIAVISTQSKQDDANARMKGIKQQLQHANIVLTDNDIIIAANTYDGGKAAVSQLANTIHRYTALLCFNDQMALGVLSALNEQAIKVPNDMSVIGFDDLIYAQCCSPKLTTIKYPIEIMAEKATELALNLSNAVPFSELSASGYKYAPQLVSRASTNIIDNNSAHLLQARTNA